MTKQLTLTEAAARVGRTRKSLLHRIRKGDLPAVYVPKGDRLKTFVHEDDVMALTWSAHTPSRNPTGRKYEPVPAAESGRVPLVPRDAKRRTLAPPALDGAACRGMDPNMFFAEGALEVQRAKQTCAACPAIEACREWGLAREEFGIFGGMTSHERAAWRREMRARMVGKVTVR